MDIHDLDKEHLVQHAKSAYNTITHAPVNVGETERWLSVAGGVGMVAYGLKTRGLMGLVLGGIGAAMLYRGSTGHCAAYDQLGINTSSDHDDANASLDGASGVKVEESIFVAADVVSIYKYWRHLSNLPHIMGHLESVKEIGRDRSHWVAKAPAGMKVEWDAEIINDRENELISWRSMPGSEIPNAGSVWFSKDNSGAGTNIKVSLMYQPPAGKLGAYIAKLMGEEPQVQIKEDLKRFKTAAEAGRLNNALSR